MTTVSALIADATDDPVLAASDALEAQAAAQARIVATYFRNLVQSGVPLELAERLAQEWHGHAHERKFWLMGCHAAQAATGGSAVPPVIS